MTRLFLFSIFFIFIRSELNCQPCKINWQHCYGGSNYENGYKIIKRGSNFYLFCGTDSNDGDVNGFHGGGGDYWLVKTDTSGNFIWGKTYGGSDTEGATDMKETADGGFVLFGDSFSNNGEVNGNHGGSDFWLVKVDSLGNIEWDKCYGGSCDEGAYQIATTPDSGFICIGYSCSDDGDVTVNYGLYDVWVVRLNKSGNILWQKSFGGTSMDWGMSIKATSDKGAIIAGAVGSSDGIIQCNYRNFDDCWVSKIDSAGNMEWQNCYGGTGSDDIVDIISTDDGGYIFTGGTNSTDGDVTGNHGDDDIWVVKINHTGDLVWQKCYGGSLTDLGLVIKEAPDGNYLVGGYTFSHDGDVTGNHSMPQLYSDMWVIKISPSGDLIWQQCFGGEDSEVIEDILVSDRGTLLLLGGTKTSNNSGDVQCDHHGPGTNDVWLLSVTDTTYVGINEKKDPICEVLVSPNPANNEVTFSVPKPVSDTKINIYNSNGQLIHKVYLRRGDAKTVINCGLETPGIYYYTYFNHFFSGAGKIIIQH